MKALLASALALLALTGCGKQVAMTDADPALWVVRDADTTIYLFGTVHVLKPRLAWFDDVVRDAFDRSDTLVLELVMPPPEEMEAITRELGIRYAGPPLPEMLPEASAAKLRDALDQLGRSPRELDRAEPWYAATTVAMLPVRELGYDPADGAEQVLARAAEAADKPVIGLETAREQFLYFDRLPEPVQRRMLIDTLDGLPDAARTLDKVIGAWTAGDPERLARLINADLETADAVRQALLIDRNRRWADWIAVRMRQPGTVFVAVGAGHLAGDGSVQEQLATKELRAERIRY